MKKYFNVYRTTCACFLFFSIFLYNHTAMCNSLAPYAVGSTIVFVHDPSQVFDEFAVRNLPPEVIELVKQPGTVRTLVTELWYPIDTSLLTENSIRAKYLDFFFGEVDNCIRWANTRLPRISPTVKEGITPTDVDNAHTELCTTRERQSYLNVPIASGTFPVVLMMPGDTQHRVILDSLAEFLASHGYVVMATDTTGDHADSQPGKDPALCEFNPPLCVDGTPHPQIFLPGGRYERTVNNGNSQRKAKDIEAMITALTELNSDEESEFKNSFNLGSIALIGLSLGGENVLQDLNDFVDIDVGIAIVPINAKIANRPFFPPRSIIEKPVMYLTSGLDTTIIGLTCFLYSLNLDIVTEPTDENRHPDILDQHLQNQSDSFYFFLEKGGHTSFTDNGQYLFPDLVKPILTVQDPLPCDGSGPIEEFIPVTTSHEIRNEKILAFLEVDLKGRLGGIGPLISERFKNEGLRIDYRIFPPL